MIKKLLFCLLLFNMPTFCTKRRHHSLKSFKKSKRVPSDQKIKDFLTCGCYGLLVDCSTFFSKNYKKTKK